MQTSNAAQQVEAVIASLFEYWNRHDTQAYAGLWAEDADFVNVVGMHRRNRAELLAELDYLHQGRFRDTQIRGLDHSVKFLSPEIALVHMRWEMSGDPGMPGVPTPPDGIRRGFFTHVLQSTPAGWRIAASQNTDVLPIPDPLDQWRGQLTGAGASR